MARATGLRNLRQPVRFLSRDGGAPGMSIFSARTFLPGPGLDSETRQSGLPAAATGTGYPESLDVNVPPSVARRAQLHPNGRATSGVEGHPTQRQNVEGDEHVR